MSEQIAHKDDARWQRTRVLLADALVCLLAESSLDDISVAQLCRAAGVHRTTFYGHGGSVAAFAVDMLVSDIDAHSQVMTCVDSVAQVQAEHGAVLTDLLGTIAARRPVYRALVNSQTRGALRVAIEERLRYHIEDAVVLLERYGARAGSEPERAMTIIHMAGATASIIEWWILQDSTDAQGVAATVLRLAPGWVRGSERIG